MSGRLAIASLDVVVASLSAVMGALGLVVYVNTQHTNLVIFAVGSLALVIATILKLVSIAYGNYLLIPIIIHTLIALFHISTGTLILNDLIHVNNHPHLLAASSSAPSNWQTVILSMFVINIIFLALSSVITCLHYIYIIEMSDPESASLTEMDQISRQSPVPKTQFSKNNHSLISLKNMSSFSINKKVSDLTLIESKARNSPQLSKDDFNLNLDQEPSELAFYIKSSIENPENHHYLNYANENWMASTPQLSNLNTDLNLSSGDLPKSRKSFRLLGSKSSLQRMESEVLNSHSTNSLLKTNSHRSFTNREPELKAFRSVPNFIRPQRENNNNVFKYSENYQQNSASKYSDVIAEQESIVAPAEPHKRKLDGLQSPVKRSKSTSALGRKSQKREQQRKSINDEKVFLSGVNESLLPPVLKKSESPIMKSKRNQELMQAEAPMEKIEKPTQERTIPPVVPEIRYANLSPVGEIEAVSSQGNNSDNSIDAVEDLEDDFLPHIAEFGEPLESVTFEGFDQDCTIVTKKKGQYQFNGVDYSTMHIRSDTYGDEPPEGALNGLEKIPMSTPMNRNVSLFEGNGDENSIGGLNQISLQEWDDNEHLYHQHRTRSGANYSIPGITRLVSDHQLKAMASDADQAIGENYLLPPLENRQDNIDNISDIHTSPSVKYARSNGSFSAPSLHTFRNVSGEPFKDTKESVVDSTELKQLEAEGLQLTLYQTPPDTPLYTTSNSSPIKKFFHESPKRISSVFRRRSTSHRLSIDMDSRHHKHTSSMVSNQLSISSVVSSRSGSPKKSLKSYLAPRSHKHSMSIPSAKAMVIKPDLKAQSLQSSPVGFHHAKGTICLEDAVDMWDLDTNQSSDRSRISSVPSVVIGEYDREKWRTLKLLENE